MPVRGPVYRGKGCPGVRVREEGREGKREGRRKGDGEGGACERVQGSGRDGHVPVDRFHSKASLLIICTFIPLFQ